MNLVIVESPTKARTLFRFLGGDFLIEATMGHVRDLPKSKFGVDLEHDFAPDYKVISSKAQRIKAIKLLSNKAERIYLATDPDREGESIAWHVNELLVGSSELVDKNKKEKNSKLQTPNSKFSRIVFHEITEWAIKEALAHPRSLDMNLVDAQQARRVLDRIVGYKLSPLLWRKVRIGLSAGRVQSVTVRLVVDREREIEAFKSEEYWEIFCEVKSAKLKVPSFLIKLIQINGQKAEIKNKRSLLLRSKEQADGVVSDLGKADYKVSSVEKKEVSKSPPPPFTTSTMVQTAARLFFWSAKRTMQLAQKLYEEGLITYHRTDSTNLSLEAVKKVRNFITKEYGGEYLPEKPRFYKTTSKVAQEAHEAIRPTNVGRALCDQVKLLGKDSEKLYSLIWKRFVACQMTNSLYDETTINVEATPHYLLQAKGQIMKFPGWRKVYGGPPAGGEKEEVQLPEVYEDEEIKLIKVNPLQKFTEPPARYTEATLIKTLEKLGIGRPSTYAPTISTIQARAYVEKKEGKFHPTPVGVAVNDFLVTNFPDVVDYKFTARMEDDLDEIANGRREWVPTVREFWEPFDKKLEEVGEKAKRVKIATEETGELCPKCKKGKQVIRIGRFGKFLSCSRFPDCPWKEQFIEKIGMECPKCAESLPANRRGEVIIRQTKRKYRFYGCSRYPTCHWASWRKPQS